MTEPLKFISDIPAMTGGKDAILAAVQRTHIDSNAQAPTSKEMKKAAVGWIVAAIKEQLRAPLTKRFEDHCRAVEEEYALIEGDPPGEDGPEAEAWNKGLDAAATEAFSGELEKVIGKTKLKAWIFSGDDAAALTELVLEHAIDDVSNAFSRLGITPADIDSLIENPTVSTAAPSPDASTATADAPAVVSGPNGKRRRSPKIEGPTPLTEASRSALIALKDHSKIKDETIAAALGVSRASVIGYREGKTLFEPTDAQMEAFHDLFDQATKPLDTARGVLLTTAVEAL